MSYDPKEERGTKGKENDEAKKAYMRQYMRDRRAKEQEIKRINEERAQKGEIPLPTPAETIALRREAAALRREVMDEEAKKRAEKKRKAKQKQRAITITQKGILSGETTDEFIMHNLRLAGLPPIDIHDEDDIAARTSEYFTCCIQDNVKTSIEGYALSLGLDRHDLQAIILRKKKVTEDVYAVINRAYSILNAQMVDYMQNNKINPVVGIYLSKNTMGYKNDEKNIDRRTEDREEQEEDNATIMAKYQDIPD